MHRDPARLLLMQRSTFRSASWTRRSFLGVGLAAAATGVLAACGAPAPSAAPTAASAAPAAAKPVQSTGELEIAIDGEFPATLDATKNAYQLVRLGLAQTLTRLSPQMKLVPWLAKDVSNVDPTTWRVALRPNARFWDGTPVTAQDVQAAFQANWAAYPAPACSARTPRSRSSMRPRSTSRHPIRSATSPTSFPPSSSSSTRTAPP
jgi:ABC-type transport system substrate-binding protein